MPDLHLLSNLLLVLQHHDRGKRLDELLLDEERPVNVRASLWRLERQPVVVVLVIAAHVVSEGATKDFVSGVKGARFELASFLPAGIFALL